MKVFVPFLLLAMIIMVLATGNSAKAPTSGNPSAFGNVTSQKSNEKAKPKTSLIPLGFDEKKPADQGVKK
ncbi:MAG: hypothetical protein V4665_02150 [Patescibacteria group bacterium]